MGIGYSFHCNNCGHDYDAWIGVGMMHPQTCEEMLEAIKAGKLGQELQAAAMSEEYVGVDAAQKVYVCDDCGCWEVYSNATVYGLEDVENGPSAMFGDRTIAEWGCIPYVTRWDDEVKCRVIKEFVPRCKKCGDSMHAIEVDEDSDEVPSLKCNNCGSPLVDGGKTVCWD